MNDIRRKSELLDAKRKESLEKQTHGDDALRQQVGNLEMQNAELEMLVEDLEKKNKELSVHLMAAKAGKIVVENLSDKTNFANLISAQGNLVEKL